MVQRLQAWYNPLQRGTVMIEEPIDTATIIRTERGLTIAGTRTTLYSVMDYLLKGRPSSVIRDRLNLSERQVSEALAYIDAHRAEVEAEYQQVLRDSEEARKYWEERNRERLAQIAAMPPRPGRESIRAKLEDSKARWPLDE
jgi:uncharacterized protein (DUF433 family)